MSHRSKILHGSIYVKYLQQSSSNKQRVEWWLSGARRRGDGAFLFEEYKVAITQDKYIIVFFYTILCLELIILCGTL